MENNFHEWGGLQIMKSNYLEPKIEKIPVRWRTWKERFFTFPFNPGELFIYEEIKTNIAIIYNGNLIVNNWTFNNLLNGLS